LAAVKPDGLFLVLELMHFAQEILSADDLVNQPAKELTPQELKMAETLVDTMSVAWQPQKYKDDYRDALMEIIEQKAQNKDIADRPSAPRPATKVVDLVKLPANADLQAMRRGVVAASDAPTRFPRFPDLQRRGVILKWAQDD
jgi:DNA end-binding protein Ku